MMTERKSPVSSVAARNSIYLNKAYENEEDDVLRTEYFTAQKEWRGGASAKEHHDTDQSQ